MRDNGGAEALLVMITCIMVFILGRESGVNEVRNEAVKHHAGIYHPETREFKWNDELTQSIIVKVEEDNK